MRGYKIERYYKDGWIKVDSEVLEKYGDAHYRLSYFDEWCAMFKYFWDYCNWIKGSNDEKTI